MYIGGCQWEAEKKNGLMYYNVCLSCFFLELKWLPLSHCSPGCRA